MSTTARLVKAVVAVALLAVMLVGFPLVFVQVGVPDLGVLIRPGELVAHGGAPLAVSAVLRLLTLVGWVAWAWFALSFLVELANLGRGVRIALPFSSVPQHVARRLLGAVLLAGAVGPGLTLPASATPVAVTAPVAAQPTVTASIAVSPAAGAPAGSSSSSSAAPAVPSRVPGAALPVLTVTEPPAGRWDCLWDIAERHLGDPLRWKEIYELNRGTVANPDVIWPGQRLVMPADATGLTPPAGATQERVQVAAGETLSGIAERELDDPQAWPQIYEASKGVTQPGGAHLVDPDVIRPGWVLTVPGAAEMPSGPSATAAPVAPPASVAPVAPRATPSATVTPSSPESFSASELRTPVPPAVTPTVTSSPSTSVSSSPEPAPAAAAPASGDAAAPESAGVSSWMLGSFVGAAGAVLAGGASLMLRRRRRTQLRQRRPGRTIAAPSRGLVPVERSIVSAGSATGVQLAAMDQALRAVAAGFAAQQRAMPRVSAARLLADELVLFFTEPVALDAPWVAGEGGWVLDLASVEVAELGMLVAEQPAPAPLLAGMGADAAGATWWVNLEDHGFALSGDEQRCTSLARYVAAGVAVNPWSGLVRMDCVDLATEIVPMCPERFAAVDPQDAHGLRAALLEAQSAAARSADLGMTVAAARAGAAGEDAWHPHLVVAADASGLGPLLQVMADNPGRSASAVVVMVAGGAAPVRQLVVDGNGRAVLEAGVWGLPYDVEVAAAALSSSDASGVALLWEATAQGEDAPVAVFEEPAEPWQEFADVAGSLRDELTVPREAGSQGESLLPEEDASYVEVAAVTTQDLAQLAPVVPVQVRSAVAQADPDLDADLAAFLDPSSGRPSLSVLGPVTVRAFGLRPANRLAWAAEALAYLMYHPHGVTGEQLAEAMSCPLTRARDAVSSLRNWLGVDDRTGAHFVPDARYSPAAQLRGVNAYQVLGVLEDRDLFLRLRVRGESRGPDGIADLRAALRLVNGRPYDQLRVDGWAWLLDNRMDETMKLAIADVAHVVTTDALARGELTQARLAAETAMLAAPDEETSKLALAAVMDAEGSHDRARSFVHAEVCNRCEDGGMPHDLSSRSTRIIAQHGWGTRDSKTG